MPMCKLLEIMSKIQKEWNMANNQHRKTFHYFLQWGWDLEMWSVQKQKLALNRNVLTAHTQPVSKTDKYDHDLHLCCDKMSKIFAGTRLSTDYKKSESLTHFSLVLVLYLIFEMFHTTNRTNSPKCAHLHQLQTKESKIICTKGWFSSLLPLMPPELQA